VCVYRLINTPFLYIAREFFGEVEVKY